MDFRVSSRWAAALIGGTVLACGTEPLRADNVKLAGGGSLNGSVITGSKSVSVRTSSGAVVVFDRSAIKQVTHGRTVAVKTGSSGADSRPQSKKRKLTVEEEAWIPKIRTLVSRLYGGDWGKSQQAGNALLKIDDTDALPALSTHLGGSRNGGARQLYIAVLHNMKGPKPVYYLVALSLYDSSPEIRAEARKALRDDQLDSARLLYIAALRSGSPHLARRAAIGLGEIGDPRGDSVPYLIDALVSYGTVATMKGSAEDLFYVSTTYSTPGPKMSGSSYPAQIASSNAAPASIGGTEASNGTSDSNDKATGSGEQPSGSNTKAMTSSQDPGFASPTVPLAAEPYETPGKKCGSHDRPLQGYVDHPEVLDALLKITDQPHPGYGFSQDRWRSWWANEKRNRDLQRPADHVAAAGTSAKYP
jgi:hypothetical protein